MLEQVGMKQGMDILVQKLGHNLPEIRCRALSSIVSKLGHGLLHETDLIQERQLFVKLLEWFNFQSAPMKEEVFQLLLRLSKHFSAREYLVSLGAIQFLTDIRVNIPFSLKGQLDALLENLFHSVDEPSSCKECHYQSTDSVPENTITGHSLMVEPDTLSGYFEESVDRDPVLDAHIPQQDDFSTFITFPGFPWHFLTATDRHVLSSTSVSLCSSNVSLIQNACSFLLDVVLQDFPTEIFLQRPTIVNTLVTLLRSRPSPTLNSIACDCLSYIASNLVARIAFYQNPDFHCPRQGLPLRKGSFLDSNQLAQYGMTDSNPNGRERNGGDGRDENSSSSVSSAFASSIQHLGEENIGFTLTQKEDDSLEDDHMAALQLSQLSVHNFCICCLQTAMPLLLVDSPALFYKAYGIGANCIRVLEHILDDHALWNSAENLAKTFQKDIESLCDMTSRVILYHYHLERESLAQTHPGSVASKICSWRLKSNSKHDMTFHRIAFHASSVLLLKFLTTVLPVKRSDRIQKDTVNTALYILACDQPFQISFPQQAKLAEKYLSHCCKDKHEIALRVQRVLQSISDIHGFLSHAKLDSKNASDILRLAESGLHALPYYNVEEFVPQVINIISEVCADVENMACTIARQLLLCLLAHPQAHVRSSVYQASLKIVSLSTSVSATAGNPSGSTHCKCAFIVDTLVLYEVTLHGFCDSSPLVNGPARDLILHLLRGKLLFSERLWTAFTSAIKPVMPILQTHMGDDELLKGAIFDFMRGNFEHHFIFQCLYRCLFLKQRKLRMAASGMLTKALGEYRKELMEDSRKDHDSLPLLDHACKVVDITDLFIVDEPLPLANSASSINSETGLFNEDSAIRMLGVFRSRSISRPIRLSALQQMSVVLSDRNIHSVFLKNDGLTSVQSHLLKLANNSVLTDSESSEVNACLTILILLSVCIEDVRSSLLERSVLMALLRIVDLCRLFPVTVSLVAQIMALLLLHDVILERVGDLDQRSSSIISMPSRVISHYQIPFLCRAHDVVSGNRKTLPTSDGCNPLLTGPAAFAIRIGIILAQADGKFDCAVDNLQKRMKCGEPLQKTDTMNLLADQIALLHVDAHGILEEMVALITGANNHTAVRHALLLLRIMLQASPEKYSCHFLESSSWQVAMEKFLFVFPSSPKDADLLLDVVSMLNDVLNTVPTHNLGAVEFCHCCMIGMEETLMWYRRMCIQGPTESLPSKEMPLFSLLHFSEVQHDQPTDALSSMTLQRQLCKMILSVVSRIARKLDAISDKSVVYEFQTMMCQIILVRLKLADTPRFYDLPSMEVTLDCLVHITATVGWTSAQPIEQHRRSYNSILPDGTLICTQLLTSLLEVVSAFHIENRGSGMSYMGKGVSKAATQSIVHLMLETAIKTSVHFPQDMPEWLSIVGHALSLSDTNGQNNTSSLVNAKISYEWIMALWTARDSRIRYSGLAIATALTTTAQGCKLIQNNFKKFTGGIWNVAFSVFFDGTECSAVRVQAASLLCNLVCHNFQKEEINCDLDAFYKLLNRVKFTQNLSEIISRYHSAYLIQPVTIVFTPYMSQMSISTSENSYHSFKDEGFRSMIPNASPAIQQYQSVAVGIEDHADFVDQEENDSEQPEQNSYASDFPAEWQSVSTPKLVAAACRLIRSVLQVSKDAVPMLRRHAVMEHMAYLIDISLLTSYMDEFNAETLSYGITKGRLGLTAKSLIEQYTETCKMLHVYAGNEKVVAFSLLQDTQLLDTIVKLVATGSALNPWKNCLETMQRSAMELLSTIMFQCRPQGAEIVRNQISKSWVQFATCVRVTLSKREHSRSLLPMMMMFTNMLNLQILDGKYSSSSMSAGTKVVFDYPSAESDCTEFTLSLIKILENYIAKIDKSSMKMILTCAEVLQAMFVRFPSCRKRVFDAGFLEMLINKVKHLHSQLELIMVSMKCTALSCKKKARKKDPMKSAEYAVMTSKIVILLRVLACLVAYSEEIQKAAATNGVGYLLQVLWCSVYTRIKPSIIRMSISYTANCEKACSSVSFATPGHQPYITCIITEALEKNAKVLLGSKVQTSILWPMYNLLLNLSLSRECRSVMWKSGFLNQLPMVADKGQHPKCSKVQRMLLVYWMRLFHALSYFADGQLNILKVTDILEILTGILGNNTCHQDMIMKILCNLCYHGPSKPRLSSNKAVLDALMKGISSQSSMPAVSAIWALLSNCQKSKVHLKVAGLAPKIHAALASLKFSATESRSLRHRLGAILDILQA